MEIRWVVPLAVKLEADLELPRKESQIREMF